MVWTDEMDGLVPAIRNLGNELWPSRSLNWVAIFIAHASDDVGMTSWA
jgi:hypothetical protein